MSTASEAIVPKMEPPNIESNSASFSQLSETVAGSQQNATVVESSLPSTVVESQSQSQSQPQQQPQTQSQPQPLGGSAPTDSQSSSTVQDGTSQPQLDAFSQITANSADTDASMMPPPTPGGSNGGASRSSGRAIKPTLKVRGDVEEPWSFSKPQGSTLQTQRNGSQGYGFRSRKSTHGSTSTNGNRAPRLKLNLKGGHASRGKGDPTLAGVNKTLPYMQGYDRELDSSDEETGEGMAFEEQIILRMPEGIEATKTLGEWIRRREVGNEGREVEVKFKDSRRALFKMGDKQFSSKLVDLPAIIESHKTLDNKQMFKIADISQMLLVSHEVQEESEVTRGNGGDRVEGLTDDFIYDHGITPPMRWARKRRFRKRIHKRTIETVEKEVERLLGEDERAEKVEYHMIDLAEADLSDSDDEEGERGRNRGRDDDGGGESPTASQAGDQSVAPDGGSGVSDLEDEFSQMGDGENMSVMGGEDEDVDQDLQRELEQEMLLQQQEDEEEEDDDEDDRSKSRGRSMSRATSDDEEEDDDDEDEEEEDDLFDAGGDDEGGGTSKAGADGNEAEEDDDDDDDLDEEEQERRVRETQLEAECKEIEAMVKRKHNEVEGTNNLLIKQRNLQTLKRMQTELDMKKSQLMDLKQQRREGKEAAKAEAQAEAEAQAQAQVQAQEEAVAATVANSAAPRTSSSATPSTAAAVTSSAAVAAATTTNNISVAADGTSGSAAAGAAAVEREKSAAKGASGSATKTKKSGTADDTASMTVDDGPDEGVEEEDDDDDDDDDDDEAGSEESDLFG